MGYGGRVMAGVRVAVVPSYAAPEPILVRPPSCSRRDEWTAGEVGTSQVHCSTTRGNRQDRQLAKREVEFGTGEGTLPQQMGGLHSLLWNARSASISSSTS